MSMKGLGMSRRGIVALVCAIGLSALGVSAANSASNPDATPRTQLAKHRGSNGSGLGLGTSIIDANRGRSRRRGGFSGGNLVPPPNTNPSPSGNIRRDPSGKPYCPDVGGYEAYMQQTGEVCVCLSYNTC